MMDNANAINKIYLLILMLNVSYVMHLGFLLNIYIYDLLLFFLNNSETCSTADRNKCLTCSSALHRHELIPAAG